MGNMLNDKTYNVLFTMGAIIGWILGIVIVPMFAYLHISNQDLHNRLTRQGEEIRQLENRQETTTKLFIDHFCKGSEND